MPTLDRAYLDTTRPRHIHLIVSTEAEILAVVDKLPVRRRAKLIGLLTRRLEDIRDRAAVRRAQKKGVYSAYSTVSREISSRRAAHKDC
jgi:hypothetical protein